jgi:hypothetical protein
MVNTSIRETNQNKDQPGVMSSDSNGHIVDNRMNPIYPQHSGEEEEEEEDEEEEEEEDDQSHSLSSGCDLISIEMNADEYRRSRGRDIDYGYLKIANTNQGLTSKYNDKLKNIGKLSLSDQKDLLSKIDGKVKFRCRATVSLSPRRIFIYKREETASLSDYGSEECQLQDDVAGKGKEKESLSPQKKLKV